MSKPLIGLTVLLLAFIQSTLADPPSDADWVKVDYLTDEFTEPGLDLSKWHGTNPSWRGRMPSQYSRSNVQVMNGELLIHATSSRFKTSPQLQVGTKYLTGTIVSRKPILYGYFEIKAKAASSKVSSSFWLYNHNPPTDEIKPSLGTEIDVFEVCGIGLCSKQVHTDAHVKGEAVLNGDESSRSHPMKIPVGQSLSSRYFTAALEWSPELLRWYLDGVVVRELQNDHWHRELYLVVDSEVMADWFGLPAESELPAHYNVDYLRVWQRR